jgi:UDP-3-O-[3-hydroxymyristoyl] glucosamine N-acyltransferase
VVLEDGVEIGANACIDRAQTDETRVGAGTKVDNLVQIGHNCRVGRDCALSAQTGISGSCRLGDRVVTAGQVGISDHVTVGDDVAIGGKSGIEKSIPAGQAVFGYPAMEARRAFQIVALVRSLPRLLARVKRLEAAAGLSGPPEESR